MAATNDPASSPAQRVKHPTAPSPDTAAATRAPAGSGTAAAPARRGYGWLLIMLLIAAMFGTPVVIAAMILIRGA